MSPLRLGAMHLPPAEAGLVRALVLLLCNDVTSELRWIFVTEAPFDALIVDKSAQNVLLIAAAPRVLYLAGADHPPDQNVLARPLRADLLRDWLSSAQAALRLISPASLPTPVPLQQVDANVITATMGATRFKLKKWPPLETLQGDRARIRMATLLGKRALTLNELVNLSREIEKNCTSFLQALQQLQLLETSKFPTELAAAASPNQPSSEQPGNSPSVVQRTQDKRWSLVRSIRSRLGLN